MRCTVERGSGLSPEERAEVANALDGMSADAPTLSPQDLAAAWRPELDRRREELERARAGGGSDDRRTRGHRRDSCALA